MNNTLTGLNGIRVGHATRSEQLTGVTAVLFDKPLPVAYACYGGSPGTLNTDALRADRGGAEANAIFISGGSWAGLQSGAQIASELIKMGVGFRTHAIVNPNVTGAIVMDLGVRIGQFDPSIAIEAVRNAGRDEVARGNVGAGTGTTVGKFRYPNQGQTFAGMKAGVGCSRVDLPNGAFISCLSVVNAVGNIINRDGSVLAGNRRLDKDRYETFLEAADYFADPLNTTISVVGTNIKLPNAS
jgi:L-aminopeptidase/D-esterase-like protein